MTAAGAATPLRRERGAAWPRCRRTPCAGGLHAGKPRVPANLVSRQTSWAGSATRRPTGVPASRDAGRWVCWPTGAKTEGDTGRPGRRLATLPAGRSVGWRRGWMAEVPGRPKCRADRHAKSPQRRLAVVPAPPGPPDGRGGERPGRRPDGLVPDGPEAGRAGGRYGASRQRVEAARWGRGGGASMRRHGRRAACGGRSNESQACGARSQAHLSTPAVGP